MPKKNIGKSFLEIKTAVEATMKEIPTIAGTEAVNHFKKSFRNQGFTDATLQKWKPRKKKDEGRAILVKTGRLRRGIKIMRQDAVSVVVGVDLNEVPYAQYHNEGGIQNVRAHKRRTKSGRRSDRRGAYAQVKPFFRKLPKRQFIGESKQLDRKIETKIAKRLDKNLNG